MPILIVADVHANLEAFQAVIEDAQHAGPIEAIWSLGDLVGYGPDPAACVELLRGYRHMAVAGNHDLAAAGSLTLRDFNRDAAVALRWTAEQLSQIDKAWLSSLPKSAVEGDFTLVHGSLIDPVWDYLVSGSRAQEHLEKQTTPYGFVGHSHLQFAFRQENRDGPEDLIVSDDSFDLKLAGRLVANPGSVGQPRDSDSRAAYAVVDLDSGTLRFHRAAYDFATVQAKMRAAGLPQYLSARLALGH